MQIKAYEGYLSDKYGKYAAPEFTNDGVPVVSLPIELRGIPAETVSLALIMIDYDAIPVCGFPWIHWSAANLTPATLIPEDFSRTATGIVQGKNSLISPLGGATDPAVTEHYAGPTPPDKDHDYTLQVFALDTKLDLPQGFYVNELRKALVGHTLATATTEIRSRS